MKLYIKHNLIFALALLAQFNASNAQQVANPTQNAPVIEPPQPGFSVTYYNLENITGQSKFNYIRTQLPDQPVQSWPSGNLRYRQVTDYFDGLGRPLQSVNMRAHQDGYDIVQHHTYDALGKKKYQYLPFAVPASMVAGQNGDIKLDAKDKLRDFYDQAGPDEPPYSRTDDDGSPMNRVVKSLAPGRNWVGLQRGKTTNYRTNNAIEEVRIWTEGPAKTDVPQTIGYYNTGELTVTESLDEDGKRTLSYTDKSGKVVLTKSQVVDNPGGKHQNYACIYYIYDNKDQLRYVIPPAAVALIDGSWDVSAVPDLCFSYFYDEKGRTVEKKVPGKDVEYIVYDKRDRPCFTQDGNLRENGKWNFILYDVQNRPVATGIADGLPDRITLAGYVNNDDTYPVNDLFYYIKTYDLYQTYPPQNLGDCTFLSFTYYDDYSALNGLNYDYSQFANSIPPASRPELVPPPQTPSTMTRGMITGSKIAVLDPSNGGVLTWIKKANFYDDNSRLIQVVGNNIKGGQEINSTVYYFQGMPWRNIIFHNNPEAHPIPGATDGPIQTYTLLKTYERNVGIAGGNDQIWKITQKINTGPVYEIASYNYDHLGRNTTKSLNIGAVLNEYNMRGFLNHINAENRTSYPFEPIFEERLCYDTGFASKLFNGNIAGIIWNGANGEKRAYGYSYDQLDRLTHAEFRLNNSTWNHTSKDYTVSNIGYDLNGNLQSMDQKGWDPVTNATVSIDKLTYTYEAATNRLKTVQDDGNDSSLPDFKNGAKDANEYDYDGNGNMIRDANKGIGSISYYPFNRTQEINVTGKGKILYFYDALGNLLRKQIAGDSAAVYDYLGGFVYKDDVLQYILNEEGRTRPVADDTSNFQTRFVYDYFIKDHLGNVRSTVTATPITASYLARHEISTANSEQLVFDNIPSVRDGKPISTDPGDTKAAHLIAENANQRIGTAIMLKVMPGDRFTINAESFYESDFKDNGTVPGSQVVESLLGALMGGSTYAGMPVEQLPENLAIVKRTLMNPELPGQIESILVQNADPDAPKAHINYLFFDDNMQLVPGLSGRFQVPVSNGGGWQAVDPGSVCNCTVGNPGTSGFVVIYVDNQSIGKNVWFDNIHVEHYTSSVLEEDHYYPFGLTVKLDQTGQGNLPGQPYKYQGIELEKHFGVEMYETHNRGLDPQLGRFIQIDPKATADYNSSPYASMANNPITQIDPLGDVTKYFSENGTMIWQTNETRGNYANIIRSENTREFTKILGTYFSLAGKMSQELLSNNLSALGTSYDLSSFNQFYDNNSKKFAAKTIAGESLEGASDITVDGKSVKKLYAEAGANIVKKNGVLTAGENIGTSEINNAVVNSDIPSEDNSSGRIIHLHPEGARIQFYKGGLFRTVNSNPVDRDGPSHSADYKNFDKYNTEKTRDVMINKTDIYLYNNDDQQTIKIPRK